MSKRYLAYFSVTAAVITLTFIFLGPSGPPPLPDELPATASEVAETEAEATQHPGWYDQWYEMRKDENGLIPRGLRTKWYRQDSITLAQFATQRGAVSPFLNHTFVGPQALGGRTRALLIDAANENRILAGAISGGLWRSANGGVTWTPLNDAAVSLAVSCITQSPFNNNLIYYGTGETRANSSGVPGDGVFKSNDGGLTFTQLTSTTTIGDMTRCWAIEHSKSDINTVYVGTNGGLWRTQDGGSTWTEVFPGSGITDVITFTNGNVMLGDKSSGIFFSTNGDAGTYTQLTSPSFPSSFNRVEIAEYPGNEDVVYAAFELTGTFGGTAGFFKSTDRGATWSIRSTPATGNTYNTYCFVIGVSPDDENRVMAAGLSIRTSTNGGLTWRSNSSGHGDHHAFANYQGNTNEFLVGSDGGVYKHTWTSTSSPTDLNDGYQTSQFYAGDYAPSGVTALGGTQDNGTWRVQTGTAFQTNGADGGFAHVSLQNGNIAYSSSQNGSFRRTTNFTAANPSWTGINTNSTMDAEDYAFINSYQINYADGDQLYCRTNAGLWRTTNRGSNWSKITNNIGTIFAIATTPETNPEVYFGGNSAGLYRINNAATAAAGTEVDLSSTVPSVATNDFTGSITVHPSSNTTLHVGFNSFTNNPKIWRVTNAHTSSPTWTDLSGDLPTQLPVNYVQADPDDPDNILFAATDFGLYYTTNGGTNWIKDVSVPNVAIFQAKLRQSDRTLFLFTHGRGIWTLPLSRFTCIASLIGFPYTEGFESDFGFWRQETDEDFNWSRRSGGTGSLNTGPSAAAEGSYYAYIESSSPNHPDKKAGLVSACFPLAFSGLESPELRFKYHMYGETMGTLTLQILPDGESTWTTIWSQSGDKGDEWRQAAVDLRPFIANNIVQFRFIGITGNSYTGDMAIDDIRLGEAMGCTNVYPYSESFEPTLGIWDQSTSDDLDWTTTTGGTSSFSTGPSSASEGDSYIYVEASGNYSKTAQISTCFNTVGLVSPQLTFDYHMFGATMGSLALEVSSNYGLNWTTVWSKSGNQGNAWYSDTVDLSNYTGLSIFLVRWTGTTGTSYTSDMALDNINLGEGFCHSKVTSYPYAESFESGLGDWTQETSDDWDWFRYSGSTPSFSTGPTTASDGAYYLYTESSSPNFPSKTMGIHACFDFSSLDHPTLTFDQHLYGATMGTLTLQISTDLGDHWVDLWSQTGDQGNAWNEVRLDLLDYAGEDMVTLRLVGLTGSSYTSDMAVDNIHIFNDPCPPVNFSNLNIISYGTDDFGPSYVEDGGLTLELGANSWKYIDFPYTVTANTVLQVDFRSTIEGEIHGIGFDNDNIIGPNYVFKFHGSQTYAFSNYDNYVPSAWTTYTIPVGTFYTGSFDRLGFINDNDANPTVGNSWFRNVRVFEGGCGPIPAPSAMDPLVPIFAYGAEPEPSMKARVWPNPFQEAIQVAIPSAFEGSTELRLMDLSGRVLIRQAGDYAGQIKSFSAPGLTAGIYMLQVRNGDYRENFSVIKTN
ncbi:MAG: T9SS type A sorting domain-containing protein [Bacteroidota bacterium]